MMTNNDKPLREMSDEELQDESMWDFEDGENLPAPVRKPRAIVSVAFPGEDIGIVSAAARNADMKLSHFIRAAALEKAAAVAPTVYFQVVPTRTQGFSFATEKVTSGEAILV